MTKKPTDRSVAKRTLYYYWQELKKHKLLAIGALITRPAEIFAISFVLPFIIAQIVDILASETVSTENMWGTFLPYIIAAIIAVVLQRILLYFSILWLWKLEIKAQYNLANMAFHALSLQTMQFHNNRFGGSLVSQTGKFVGGFERLFDTIIFSLFPILLNVIFTVVILAPVVPWYVVGMLVFVGVYTFIVAKSFGKIAKLNEMTAKAENKQSGQLADSITNILTVKSYAQEAHEKLRFTEASENVRKTTFEMMRGVMRRDVMFGIVMVVGITALLVLFATGHTLFGISIGTLVLIFTYSNNILWTIWELNHVFRNFNKSLGDAYEMTKVLDAKNEVENLPGAIPLEIEHGAIDFESVTFSHADGKEPVFKGLSMAIEPGQRVGLVGRSGSGKTTLTKLLLRFADVDEGAITIDGQNISLVTQGSLRRGIAYVPQETTLFHRTIGENIAYGKPDATRQEIEKAAKLANAWEFIKDLPKGLNTLTGERGVKLSGGQRQRVAIARAILKDAPILVLDEATASLDTESEKLIQEAMSRLMEGRTSIVIAHRLSTVAGLDRIIVLDKGKIVEDGTHEELLKKGKTYSQLWNKQTGVLE